MGSLLGGRVDDAYFDRVSAYWFSSLPIFVIFYNGMPYNREKE